MKHDVVGQRKHVFRFCMEDSIFAHAYSNWRQVGSYLPLVMQSTREESGERLHSVTACTETRYSTFLCSTNSFECKSLLDKG